MKKISVRSAAAALSLSALCCSFTLHAQQREPATDHLSAAVFPQDGAAGDSSSLPEAPLPANTTGQDRQATEPSPANDTMPGKGSLFPSIGVVLPGQHPAPQTVGQKFVTATESTMNLSFVAVRAVVAGVDLERNSIPEFGGGGLGYARYLWHTAADQAVENYTVGFIVPAITHEDTRFYVLGRGSVAHRTGYALSRVFVTRTDDGRSTFNYSEIIGAGMASGISNLYYPRAERTAGNTAQWFGINVGLDAATFVVKELWLGRHAKERTH